MSKRDEHDVADALLAKVLATVVAVREWATRIIGTAQVVEPDPDSTTGADVSTPGA